MPEEKQKGESYKDQLKQTWDKVQDHESVKKVKGFVDTNRQDAVAYVLLFLGVVLLFFLPFLGGALLGIVFGFAYSEEIVHFLSDYQGFLRVKGTLKFIALLAVLLAFFLAYPLLFVAIAAAVALRQFL